MSECAHRVINDPDDEAAAWASRDVLVIGELAARDLEAVTARARIVEHLLGVVPAHILDLDFIIVGAHCAGTSTLQSLSLSLG
jgi:hypothetical protein